MADKKKRVGSHGSKADTATAAEADWSFCEIPGVTEALKRAAGRVARDFHVDHDELYQEACMFLAVRPETVAKDLEKGGVDLLAFAARNVMLTRAETAANRVARTEQYLWEKDDDGNLSD